MNLDFAMKPCPICGKEVILCAHYDSLYREDKYRIWCPKCLLTTMGFDNQDDLLNYWNQEDENDIKLECDNSDFWDF